MREDSSEDLTGENSTTVVRRFAAGEIELIGRPHDLFNKEMIGSAKRLFRSYPGCQSADVCCFLFGVSLHPGVTGSATTLVVSRLQS